MVAEKLDPIVDQLCFPRNFQTVRNLQKGTTEMSSEGQKLVGGRYGMAGNGLKWPENQEKPAVPRWRPPPLHRPDPGASGGGWPGNFTAGVVWMSPSSLSGACCRWPAGGASFGPNPHGSQMVKRPNLVFTIFESFSYGFGAQNGVFGLGFHFASKVMFI